jgi:hypothetical protein
MSSAHDDFANGLVFIIFIAVFVIGAALFF